MNIEEHCRDDWNLPICLNISGSESARLTEADVCISGFYDYPLTARLQCWLSLQLTSSWISPSPDFFSSVCCRSEMLQNMSWNPFIKMAFELQHQIFGYYWDCLFVCFLSTDIDFRRHKILILCDQQPSGSTLSRIVHLTVIIPFWQCAL